MCDIAERYAGRDWIELISFFAGACIVATRRGFRARIVTWSDYLTSETARWAAHHGIAGVSCEGFILVPDFAATFNQAGLGISVGTVNSVDQAGKLFACRPEILVSDRPGELRRELRARGAQCTSDGMRRAPLSSNVQKASPITGTDTL